MRTDIFLKHKHIAVLIWGLALGLLSIAAQAQVMTGITISGPTEVPNRDFSPAVAIYTVTATYADGTQGAVSSVTWTRVLNSDPSQSNTTVSSNYLINKGLFTSNFLTATVMLNGSAFTDHMTIVTSATAPVPTTTYTSTTVDILTTTPPHTSTSINASINDPYYPYQTSLFTSVNSGGGINLDGAWTITTGDPNLVVGIIDMGVLNHADLAGRFLQGYNFVEGLDNGLDPGGTSPNSGCFTAWHGTNVAGIIGANNNTIGVTGINQKSKMLPVRAVQSFMGTCYGSDIQNSDIIAKAIRWASGLSVAGVPMNPTPAKVLNMSLKGADACTSSSLASAVADAAANGTTVVISAGNEGTNSSNYSLCPDAIWVAAVDQSGAKASFSNTGSGVTIAAPGSGGIYTTMDSGTSTPNDSNTYGSFSGTSAAAPFVTGVVSLMLSANPSLTPRQVKQMLVASARTFPTNVSTPCTTSECGAGILDAAAAVTLAVAAPGAATQQPVVSTSDCIFNWTEQTYPQYFYPASGTSTTFAPYYYRHYSSTDNYLAISSVDNHIWVLGPSFGNGLLDVGPSATFASMAGCSQ